MQSRKSAIIIGVAAVAATAIIIAVAIIIIPEPVRKGGQGPSGNNASNTTNEVRVNREYKISTTTGAINSPYATEYKLSNGTWPSGTMVDSRGNLWTVGSRSDALLKFDPTTGIVKSYPLPNAGAGSSVGLVWAMVEAKDGSIWFSGFGGNNPLWRFDPNLEKFEAVDSLSASPIQMKVDKNGNIWYTTLFRGVIGAIVANQEGAEGSQKYNVKELDLGKDSFPSGLFLQNQTLWITESVNGKIALFHITPGDGGKSIADVKKVAEFPQQETLFSPTDIIMNNGSAWLTEHGTSFLTEYNTKTQEVKRYPTALHPIQISTLPYWLAEDPDEKGVWFNEHRGNRIAFFDFGSRTLTEYEVPTRNPQMGYTANVLTMAADPTNENRAWFTEWSEDKIGYIDKSVSITFGIHTPDKQIILEKGQTANLSIEITRNPKVELFNKTLSFNASSSAVQSGVLLNATASFTPESIDLSKIIATQTVMFELKDQGIRQGQHILAVSATDGAVIRTVYLELVVK